jgi:hypothetical protein
MWIQEKRVENPPPQQLEFDGLGQLARQFTQKEVFEFRNSEPLPKVEKPPSRRPKSSNGGGVPL